MDKLTSRFQQALAEAQSLAVGRDHNQIEPVHVMLALLDQEGASTAPLLGQAGVNPDLLRSRLMTAVDALPRVGEANGEVQIGPDLGRMLNLTDKLAQQRKDQFISSELFVLAALDDKGALGRALKQVHLPIFPVIDSTKFRSISEGPIQRHRMQAQNGLKFIQ